MSWGSSRVSSSFFSVLLPFADSCFSPMGFLLRGVWFSSSLGVQAPSPGLQFCQVLFLIARLESTRPISNGQIFVIIWGKYFAIVSSSGIAPNRISHTEKPNTKGVDAFIVARNSDFGYFNLLLQVSSYSSKDWAVVADCYDIIFCQVYLFALPEKRMYFEMSKYFVRLRFIVRGALGEVRKMYVYQNVGAQ